MKRIISQYSDSLLQSSVRVLIFKDISASIVRLFHKKIISDIRHCFVDDKNKK